MEAIPVPFDSFVQTFCHNPVEMCQIIIQHNFMVKEHVRSYSLFQSMLSHARVCGELLTAAVERGPS